MNQKMSLSAILDSVFYNVVVKWEQNIFTSRYKKEERKSAKECDMCSGSRFPGGEFSKCRAIYQKREWLVSEQWRDLTTLWVLHLLKHERRKKKNKNKKVGIKDVFDAHSAIFFKESHLAFYSTVSSSKSQDTVHLFWAEFYSKEAATW